MASKPSARHDKKESAEPDVNGSELRNSQNDIAILGGDVDSTKEIEKIQNDGLEEYSRERYQHDEGSDEEYPTANASTKVKVTHLELPFGKGDSKSAEEALNVMKKITKNEKEKVKVSKNTKGAGFTLTGLPSTLDTAEVTQIAKGVASVMDNDKEGSGEEQRLASPSSVSGPKGAANVKPMKGAFGTMNPVESGNSGRVGGAFTGGVSTNGDISGGFSGGINGGMDGSTNGGMDNSINGGMGGGITGGIGGSSLNAINEEAAGAGDGASYSHPHEMGMTAAGGMETGLPLGNPRPPGPEIESVSVVGNLAEQSFNTANPGHISDHMKPHLGSMYATHHRKQGRHLPMIGMMGGDSIGTPISDMLPGSQISLGGDRPVQIPIGTSNLATHFPATAGQQTPGMGNAIDQSLPVAGSIVPDSADLPINRLTDYDILDVDLEGLSQMKAMGPIQSQIGLERSFLGQKLAEPELPSGIEDATFIGERLNAEANDVDNLMTLKKKKIEKSKQDKPSNKIMLRKKSETKSQENRRSHIQKNNKTLRNLSHKSFVHKVKSTTNRIINQKQSTSKA